MNRKLVHLLLICFSLSIVGLAFHHHASGVSHHTCLICSFVSHHPKSVVQDAPQIPAPASNVFVHLPGKYGQYLLPILPPLLKPSPSCIRAKDRNLILQRVQDRVISSSSLVLLMDA